MPATLARGRNRSLFTFTGWTRYLPLLFCGGFFLLTIALFFLGPLRWPAPNVVALAGFLAAYAAALAHGYHVAVRRRERPARGRPLRLNPSWLLIACALVSLALYPWTVHTLTGRWYPDVVLGLTDPGRAYQQAKIAEWAGSRAAIYVRILLGPFTIMVFPLTVLLWPRLNRLARVLGCLAIAASVALTVAQGVNRGIAELAGYGCLVALLVWASSLKKGAQARRRRWQAIGAAVAVLALFAGYYTVNMLGRLETVRLTQTQTPLPTPAPTATPATTPPSPGGPTTTPATTPAPATPATPRPTASGTPKHDTVEGQMDEYAAQGIATRRPSVVDLLPSSLQPRVRLLDMYLTHGYYGLSLALDEPYTPTWGLGFSDFVRHNVCKVTGQPEQPVVDASYPGKVTKRGWNVGGFWATFFIYPASDLTFFGVIPLMWLMGFGWASAWRDFVRRGDPFAAGVFFYLCIAVFYLCANNTLFQNGELAVGFTVVTALWLLLRRHWPLLPGTTEDGRPARGADAGAPRPAAGPAEPAA